LDDLGWFGLAICTLGAPTDPPPWRFSTFVRSAEVLATHRGYATEAVARVLDYAFADLKLDRVAAVVRLAKTASLHVLDKLGFHQVGHRRDDGRQRCDEYRLAQEDWQQYFTHCVPRADW
jgi:RimJ/RimL family protein N-acetyltransferase